MTRLEALFYAALYGYIALGAGHIIAKLRRLRDCP